MEFYRMLSEHYDEIFPASGELVRMAAEMTPAGGSLLDVGCATGALIKILSEEGFRAEGLEYSPELIRYDKGVTIGDMHNLPYDDGEFNTLLCTGNTLAHVKDAAGAAQVLSEFARVLKKGGSCIIQILNYKMILDKKPVRLPDIDTGKILFERLYEYEEGNIRFTGKLGGAEEHVYLYPLTEKELDKAAELSGLTVKTAFGGFDGKPFEPDVSFPLIKILQK